MTEDERLLRDVLRDALDQLEWLESVAPSSALDSALADIRFVLDQLAGSAALED